MFNIKNYLYVINKKENKKNNKVEKIINDVKEWEHEFITYIQGDIECYFYTNESFNENIRDDKYFYGFSGQLAETFENIKNGLLSSGNGNEKKYVSELSGAHSISFLHLASETVQAFNSFSGVNPVYYCETDEKIVIGVDPLVVSCVSYDHNKPEFDLSNISSFLMMGYYFSHDTIFKNVKSIPHNSFITVINKIINIEQIDDSVNNMFSSEPNQALYDEITNAFLDSFNVIPETSKPLTVGLTGGKDSRLIALGLKEQNINFNAITRGNEDHPDVKVAKLLARTLNLNHKVNSPVNKKINEIKIDLVDKILKTMMGTNGLLYGYENIKYSPKYIGNIGVTGVGAEALRGGFGITREKEVDNISEFLLSTYFPYQEVILPKYRDKYINELIQIGDKSKSLRETGNKLFIEFYNGKRTAGARSALLYYNNSLSPFFDSNFLKKATKVNIDEIANEKLHFNLMNNLNSEISMLPFANDRWKFEKRGPLNPDDFNGWIQRQPVVANTKRGGYNWRLFRNKDKVFIEAFKSLLLDDDNSKIYDVVDYNKIKKIFEGTISGNYNRVLWGLLSIKLYVDYFESQEITSNIINLDLPESRDISVKVPNIYNLVNSINSLNDRLEINDNLEIIVNQKSDKYGYLVIGDGNLTTPASKIYDNLLLIEKDRKSISVRICLDVYDELSNVSLYIMFFDKVGKRISSKEYKQDMKEGINYLSKTVKHSEDAYTIKFAIKIKSAFDQPVLKIKYGYMKYN